ncbi:MAG: Asp-tRNA(Asn)/Glu-tRNA(Gln) amidotransferase subunit GatA [Chloroflexi bacterium]|nr:Asp-tRNA(Asn)/Glu-tRNA(Gln) amidotransferase subunit GatA [Chloroflexota bacterium]
MRQDELFYLTVAEDAARVRARKLSPVELVQAHLDRIARVDKKLNAYITVAGEQALAASQAAERALRRGQATPPLLGIPFAVKDLLYTRGVRTTGGSQVLEEFVPDHDATVVERLRGAGAILLGKLNLMEFAMGGTYTNDRFGPTRNPWDLDRYPGGSSSGSAAAVAAGLCMASLGTDTGGSIRGPAHNCGIVGLKPTYGRVSRHGVVPLSWSLDHVGPMTRTVEDCALVLQAIAGHDPRDATSSVAPVPDYLARLKAGLRGLRVGVLRGYFSEGLTPQVAEALQAALAVLGGQGAVLSDVSPRRVEKCQAVYQAIAYAEASAYHRPWLESRPSSYGPNTRARLEQGLTIPATAYLEAQQERKLLLGEFLEALKAVDVLVAPVSAQTAPRLDDEPPLGVPALGSPLRYSNPLNLVGLPAVSVPIGFAADGLPTAMQIVGRPFDEATALRVAYAYEQATPWHTRHPDL